MALLYSNVTPMPRFFLTKRTDSLLPVTPGLATKSRLQYAAALAVMALLTGFGATMIFRSSADTPAAIREAEDGVVTGNADATAFDAGASANRRVLFGANQTAQPLGKRMSFGVFTTSNNGSGQDWTVADITSLETRIGHKVSPVQYFSDFETGFRLADCQALAGGGRTILVAWEPNVTTQSIINGTSDAYIKKFAADVAKCPAQVAIRLFPEMNGAFADYSPYHDRDFPGDPDSTHTTSVAQLVQAYRHVVTTFRSTNTRVLWVFAPNQTDDPTDANNRMEDYYPGDAYNDVLAFDAYNWGDGGSFGSWQSAHDVYIEPYTRLTALNTTQPVWVTETSSKEPLVDDGFGKNAGKSKGQWITDLFNDTSFPRLKAVVWFDINKQTKPPQDGERDWRINSSDDSQNALKQALTMTP